MHMNREILACGIIIALFAFFGCMKNYGRFAIDNQVVQDVHAGVAAPGLRFYYTGRDTMPYAIIGIDRTYYIHSRYWVEFDPKQDRLKKMSQNIYSNSQDDAFGARIIGTDGKTIGIWYSTVFNRSVRVDEKKKTVQVLFLNPENDSRPAW